MFNLEFVAANVGSNIVKGGDVFKNEQLTSDASGKITLSTVAVPVKAGSPTYVYLREADAVSDKRTKYIVADDNTVSGLKANTVYCARYSYTDAAADKLVINSQFIPDTLYAVLTTALYAGDDKNPESGTKVGEVEIRIPRLQLSGSSEISMTAAGTSTTALEGTALATGATGCDGKGIYAEIVQVIYNKHWYDDAAGLIIEDSYVTATAGDAINLVPNVYAWYDAASPKMLNNDILAAQESGLAADERSHLVFAIDAGGTGLNINANIGAITGTAAAGTATITVKALKADDSEVPGMDASMTIVVA